MKARSLRCATCRNSRRYFSSVSGSETISHRRSGPRSCFCGRELAACYIDWPRMTLMNLIYERPAEESAMVVDAKWLEELGAMADLATRDTLLVRGTEIQLPLA